MFFQRPPAHRSDAGGPHMAADGRVSLVDGEEMRTLRCHLKETPDKYVTFRFANPGQRFDSGIKYVRSSKSSNKTFNVIPL